MRQSQNDDRRPSIAQGHVKHASGGMDTFLGGGRGGGGVGGKLVGDLEGHGLGDEVVLDAGLFFSQLGRGGEGRQVGHIQALP